MEIINNQYRENIISNCCSKKVYLNGDECSSCLEHCSFLIEEPTAFHKWLLKVCDNQHDKIVAKLRNEILMNQNPQVFELMDMVDEGSIQYGNFTLIVVANMLLETKHTTQLMDGGKLIKQKKPNLINKAK